MATSTTTATATSASCFGIFLLSLLLFFWKENPRSAFAQFVWGEDAPERLYLPIIQLLDQNVYSQK